MRRFLGILFRADGLGFDLDCLPAKLSNDPPLRSFIDESVERESAQGLLGQVMCRTSASSISLLTSSSVSFGGFVAVGTLPKRAIAHHVPVARFERRHRQQEGAAS